MSKYYKREREIKEQNDIFADRRATHQPKMSKVLLLDTETWAAPPWTCLDNMRLATCRPVYTRVWAAPRRVYTTKACAACTWTCLLHRSMSGICTCLHRTGLSCTWTCLHYKVLRWIWTCLLHRGLSCTWTCLLHRGLSCSWTCLDNRCLCCTWTCLLHRSCASPRRVYSRGPLLYLDVSTPQVLCFT